MEHKINFLPNVFSNAAMHFVIAANRVRCRLGIRFFKKDKFSRICFRGDK